MRSRPLSTTVLLACCLVLSVVACAEQDAARASNTNTSASLSQDRFALLTLSAATGHSPRIHDDVEVTGQFVAFTGPDTDWAVSTLDLWVPDQNRLSWRDQCRVNLDAAQRVQNQASDDIDAISNDVTIELLEAGDVELVERQPLTLEPRHVPDLMTFFSGVVYRLQDEQHLPYTPGQALALRGHGGANIGPFDVSLHAPSPMVLLAVDGQPYGTTIDIRQPRYRDLNVEWSSEDPSERVYFDLYHDELTPTPLLSCTAIDDGTFSIPQDALAQLREAFPEASFRLIARRASLADFDVEGVSWARAIFITSDLVFLTP